MIEPTETESKETLDAFAEALFRITEEDAGTACTTPRTPRRSAAPTKSPPHETRAWLACRGCHAETRRRRDGGAGMGRGLGRIGADLSERESAHDDVAGERLDNSKPAEVSGTAADSEVPFLTAVVTSSASLACG